MINWKSLATVRGKKEDVRRLKKGENGEFLKLTVWSWERIGGQLEIYSCCGQEENGSEEGAAAV